VLEYRFSTDYRAFFGFCETSGPESLPRRRVLPLFQGEPSNHNEREVLPQWMALKSLFNGALRPTAEKAAWSPPPAIQREWGRADAGHAFVTTCTYRTPSLQTIRTEK